MPTQKQKDAAEATTENHRNKQGKTKGEILKEVGYSDSMSESPGRSVYDTEGYKEAEKPFLEALEEERNEALKEMKNKRDDANYSELTRTVTSFTEKGELLKGNATSREVKKEEIPDMTREERREYIKLLAQVNAISKKP